MKMKYLSMALAAILATTLTACGDDKEPSYDAKPTPEMTAAEKEAAAKAAAEKAAAEKAAKEAAEKAAQLAKDKVTDTDGDKIMDDVDDDIDGDGVKNDKDSDPRDPKKGAIKKDPPTKGDELKDDNIGKAAETEKGDILVKSSVVGQNYIRGPKSQFDKTAETNIDPKDTGNSTVLGYIPLQNKMMSNIVVAQYGDVSNKDADGNAAKVKYILGEHPNATPSTNPVAGRSSSTDYMKKQSIQQVNSASLATAANRWEEGIVTISTAATGANAATTLVANHESALYTAKTKPTLLTETGRSSNLSNKARVYGSLYSVNSNNANRKTEANTTMLVPDASKWKTAPAAQDPYELVEEVNLSNVQYGRVTGALETLDAAAIKGKTYVRADFTDKNFAGNSKQTDVYFYRGLNQTKIDKLPSGQFEYFGHALMYGIDNTYTGQGTGEGESNSVAYGVSGAGVGNFVHAKVDFDKDTVKGSIYNVWNLDQTKKNKKKAVNLVEFNGKITGSTFKGEASRTYGAGKGKKDATVKGSFFGSAAQEMGGNINTVKSGYDKSTWGGVFGAQTKEVKDIVVGVPPISAVE